MNFGKKLKTLRKEHNLTQRELADRIFVSKSVISYYEKNERTPSPEVIVKLAYVFNVTTDFLLEIRHARTIDLTGFTDEETAAITNLIDIIKKSRGR